jgi:hypothetical protein
MRIVRIVIALLIGAVGVIPLLSIPYITNTAGATLAIIVAVCCFVVAARMVRAALKYAKLSRQNVDEGVIAAFENLRLTPTELIEGYKASARRHPLAGLSARVETTGTVTTDVSGYIGPYGGNVASTKSDDRVVHVTIEGPRTAIVYTVKLKVNSNADTEARKFAAQLNMASRQLQGGPPTSGALTMPLPPPGWHPDPSGAPGSLYWDGQGWHKATSGA